VILSHPVYQAPDNRRCPQAVALLSCFDPEMGQSQRLVAAQLVYARLAQPLHFWGSVAPAVLTATQQKELEAAATPWLAAVDRANLTGRYVLNLSRPLDRLVDADMAGFSETRRFLHLKGLFASVCLRVHHARLGALTLCP
jgi:hypothetical protein